MNNIEAIREAQKCFFERGRTKDKSFRMRQLTRLYQTIEKYEEELFAAFLADLNKPGLEAYETEIGQVKAEIRHLKKHLTKWMCPKTMPGGLASFPSVGQIYQEPYGVVLIMAPWNYPFMLSMEPLAGAIAAGNCVILKPSEYAPAVSRLMKKMLGEIYPQKYVAVIEGGRTENQELLHQPFDYIFFTGSTAVGKYVMESAAKYLTPISLELGGKSPCIVDETADVSLAAKRIVWGKFLNAGQTCVAPDYVVVQEKQKEALLANMRNRIEEMYGRGIPKEFPRIVNKKHFERLMGLLQGQTILMGGEGNKETLQIAPTLLDGVSFDAPVMQEEIFGPILPVLTYGNTKELFALLRQKPKPLACYYFTRSRQEARKMIEGLSFGGGCINDTILHLTGAGLPFGGVGASGMGAYHGKYSFDTFSHEKSILYKPSLCDMPLRYPPYKEWYLQVMKKVLK